MKTVIEMAREAGLRVGPAGMGQTVWGSDEELERFAELVRADEREACAKVCEGWDFVPGGHEFTPQQLTKNLTDTITTQIRARSNT